VSRARRIALNCGAAAARGHRTAITSLDRASFLLLSPQSIYSQKIARRAVAIVRRHSAVLAADSLSSRDNIARRFSALPKSTDIHTV